MVENREEHFAAVLSLKMQEGMFFLFVCAFSWQCGVQKWHKNNVKQLITLIN